MTADAKRIEEDRAILRGQRAQALLNDDMLKEAFASVEASITQAWATSGTKDSAERESCYLMLGLLRRLKNHLEHTASTGRAIETSRVVKDPRRFGIITR